VAPRTWPIPRIRLAALLLAAILTLALAPRAGAFVYWSDFGTSTIGRANLDGTGADQRFITRTGDPDQPGGVSSTGWRSTPGTSTGPT
jgi:hypothetical protein